MNAEYWNCTNSEYHADTSAVGHTMLEMFRKSPRLYEAHYVTKTLSREQTAAMRLGTALHAFILENDKFDSLIAVEPDLDRRTNHGKAAYADFQLASIGKTVITLEQREVVDKMAKSLLAHPQVVALFKQPHKREQAIKWQDEETGLWCKCKPDVLCDSGLIGDLKTANDPTPGEWIRQAADLGYNRQNALYSDGVRELLGTQPRFMHVVIGNNEKSGFECACYFLDAEAVALGRRQNRKALNELADCLKRNDFSARWNREIEIRDLPKWAYFVD